MNWITNYVRPRINSIFSRREVPENLWSKCDNCGTNLWRHQFLHSREGWPVETAQLEKTDKYANPEPVGVWFNQAVDNVYGCQ